MSNNCCWNTITASDVTVSTTEVTITIPATTFVDDCNMKYRIYVPQTIPDSASGLPILVDNGGTVLPLWTCGEARSVLGHPLRVLRREVCCTITHCLPVAYVNSGIATNPAHLTILHRLPCACV